MPTFGFDPHSHGYDLSDCHMTSQLSNPDPNSTLYKRCSSSSNVTLLHQTTNTHRISLSLSIYRKQLTPILLHKYTQCLPPEQANPASAAAPSTKPVTSATFPSPRSTSRTATQRARRTATRTLIRRTSAPSATSLPRKNASLRATTTTTLIRTLRLSSASRILLSRPRCMVTSPPRVLRSMPNCRLRMSSACVRRALRNK